MAVGMSQLPALVLQVIALSDAIAHYRDVAASDFVVSYASIALHEFTKDTRNSYGALRRLTVTVRRQPGATARECLQDHILGIVRTTDYDSGVRRILAAARVLEKFKWIPPLVCPMDWKLVDAVAACHHKRRCATNKYWASMRVFGSLCRLASQPDEWEVVSLAALSIAFGLRAKEAVTAYFDGKSVHWQGAKGCRGPCEEVPGPWTAQWAQLLWDIRARHSYHPERPAWHPTRQSLDKALVSRPNSGCSLLRWHGWRRFGSAQLRCLGAPTDTQLRWGAGRRRGCCPSIHT